MNIKRTVVACGLGISLCFGFAPFSVAGFGEMPCVYADALDDMRNDPAVYTDDGTERKRCMAVNEIQANDGSGRSFIGVVVVLERWEEYELFGKVAIPKLEFDYAIDPSNLNSVLLSKKDLTTQEMKELESNPLETIDINPVHFGDDALIERIKRDHGHLWAGIAEHNRSKYTDVTK